MSARLYDQLQHFRRSLGTEMDGAEPRRRHAPPDPETSRVKRRLFGPVDHEENLRFVKREIAKNLEENTAKYNFDFANGRPLKDGRFEWEVLGAPPAAVPPTTVPPAEAAAEDRLKEEPCDKTAAIRDQGSERAPIPVVSDSGGAAAGTSSATSSSSARSQSQRQSSVLDHFKQKKRSRSKVKVQERKSDEEEETPTPIAATTSNPEEKEEKA